MESKYLWLLDNGHAKSTPGKRSLVFENGAQLFEYEYTRDLVSRIAAKLEAVGISYHILIPETDEDIPVIDRATRANQFAADKPKLYVSVHGNANGFGQTWDDAHGIETFYCIASSKGKRMAGIFQKKLIELTGLRDRGVKTAEFVVLNKTQMPAIRTENGFYTNKDECAKMADPAWRELVAEAHFQAIIELDPIL
ncbi:MAG: N-acetylmuramoyl-L-alanine amidase [Bacteroidota bacterium]